MKAIIKKLLHEFLLAKGKFILCVLATAVSGWGISTVVYSYLMAERDFRVNFGETSPADIAITIDNYQPAIAAGLMEDSQVEDIERREMILSRVKNNKGVWMTLLLFGCED